MKEYDLADALDALAAELAEEITAEDLRRHAWLRKIVLASDAISGKVWRDDLGALKEGSLGD